MSIVLVLPAVCSVVACRFGYEVSGFDWDSAGSGDGSPVVRGGAAGSIQNPQSGGSNAGGGGAGQNPSSGGTSSSGGTNSSGATSSSGGSTSVGGSGAGGGTSAGGTLGTGGTQSPGGGLGGSGGFSGSGGSVGSGGSSGTQGVDCSSGSCRRVFVTAASLPSGSIGSAVAGDSMCQTRADARSLGGTWHAWLSDSRTDPAQRFVKANVPYVLLTGTVIANNWADLTDGSLAHVIDVYETLNAVPAGTIHEVWTGTNIDGGSSKSDCRNWTAGTSSAEYGQVGLTNQSDAKWTNMYLQFCDRTDLHLYCFEQ